MQFSVYLIATKVFLALFISIINGTIDPQCIPKTDEEKLALARELVGLVNNREGAKWSAEAYEQIALLDPYDLKRLAGLLTLFNIC